MSRAKALMTINSQMSQWLKPIKTTAAKRNFGKLCVFYHDVRHNTEECIDLKDIESLILQGYLKRFMLEENIEAR